jgi:hypothetical protein
MTKFFPKRWDKNSLAIKGEKSKILQYKGNNSPKKIPLFICISVGWHDSISGSTPSHTLNILTNDTSCRQKRLWNCCWRKGVLLGWSHKRFLNTCIEYRSYIPVYHMKKSWILLHSSPSQSVCEHGIRRVTTVNFGRKTTTRVTLDDDNDEKGWAGMWRSKG